MTDESKPQGNISALWDCVKHLGEATDEHTARLDKLMVVVAKIAPQLEKIEGRLDKLEARPALRTAPKDPATAGPQSHREDLARLPARLDALEASPEEPDVMERPPGERLNGAEAYKLRDIRLLADMAANCTTQYPNSVLVRIVRLAGELEKSLWG